MLPKNPAEMTEADFQLLIANAVTESQTLDYKRDLPPETRDGNKEFVADITAFANTSGGDLVFGIDEGTDGAAGTLCGVEVSNFDDLRLRFQNICRDSVKPRLPPPQIERVSLGSGRWIVIVRAAKSWQAPHRNEFDHRYYRRNPSSKYAMDPDELRIVFTAGELAHQRIRRFREERLAAIDAGRTAQPLQHGIRLVLHIVPLESVMAAPRLNLNTHQSPLEAFSLINHRTSRTVRINLDGALVHSGRPPVQNYLQLYRSGMIESVSVVFPESEGRKVLTPTFETRLLEAAIQNIAQLRLLGIAGPAAVLVSLLDVRDSTFDSNGLTFPGEVFAEDRIVLPDVLIENDTDLTASLREVFAIVWNAYAMVRPDS